MFLNENLTTVWLIYALSCVGLFVVWWFMTRWIKFSLVRNLLRVAVAVALTFPYGIEEQSEYMAPAIMMMFAEGLFVKDAGFARAGIPLLIAVVVALIIYLVADLVWQRVYKARAAKMAKESEQMQAHDELVEQSGSTE